MGLTSLPILNKTGYTNFWQNIWSNNFLYNYYFSFFIMSNILFESISYEKFIIYNFKRIHKKKHYSSLLSYSNFRKKMSKIYIGEVWILKYSKWIILSPNYYYSNTFNSKYFKVIMNYEFFFKNSFFCNNLF